MQLYEKYEALVKENLLVFNLDITKSKYVNEDICNLFLKAGFDVVLSKKTNEPTSSILQDRWIIICYNTRLNLKKYLCLANKRVLFKFHKTLSKQLKAHTFCCHCIYGQVALDIIDDFFQKEKLNIYKTIADKEMRYTPTTQALDRLDSNSLRSRVDVISVNGKKYVRKLFYDGYEDYFNNELNARKAIQHQNIGKIIEVGPNYFIMPYYNEKFSWNFGDWSFFPIKVAKEFMLFMHEISIKGYAMVDWNPKTIVRTDLNVIKIVDFEFFQSNQEATEFKKSGDYTGNYIHETNVPLLKKLGYNHFWLPAVGVSYDSLMNQHAIIIRLQQIFYFVSRKVPNKISQKIQKIINFIRINTWISKHKIRQGHVSGTMKISTYNEVLSKQIIKNKRTAFMGLKEFFHIDDILNSKSIYYISKLKKNESHDSDIILKKYIKSSQSRSNNAQTIFLGGSSAWSCRKFKNIGHAQYLCIPISYKIIVFLPAYLRYCIRKLLVYKGVVKISGLTQRWIILENCNHKFSRGPRYFINPSLSANQIFQLIKDLDYILLRWPQDLCDLDKLSDIDILISDDDLPVLIKRLDESLGTRALDLYSYSGFGNHGIYGIAYYPPHMSTAIIEGAINGPYGAKIPNHEHAYLSFAYHLIFHKKPKINDINSKISQETWPFPKYFNELIRLSNLANYSSPLTINDICNHLKEKNWFPPKDSLSVYIKEHKHLYHLLEDEKMNPAGLGVFIIREIGEKYELINKVEIDLNNNGFSIILSKQITNNMRPIVAAQMRGGNWSSPNDREEEGGPAHLIITHDSNPKTVKRSKIKKKYPRLDNQRMLIKHNLRKKYALEQGLQAKHFNLIHSSDNTNEAIDYIKIINPEYMKLVKNRYKI